ESLHHGGGRSDGVPARHGGAAVDGAEADGSVAFHEDLVADVIAALEADAEGALEVLGGVLVAELEGVDVGGHELFLALELLADEILEDIELQVQQGRQGPDVD